MSKPDKALRKYIKMKKDAKTIKNISDGVDKKYKEYRNAKIFVSVLVVVLAFAVVIYAYFGELWGFISVFGFFTGLILGLVLDRYVYELKKSADDLQETYIEMANAYMKKYDMEWTEVVE